MNAWFANPLYLIGAVGVLLPVLIHLLTREQVMRVDFPTLRFFVGTARATLARKRWWEMLLIALRMLACLLLVLMFANPLFLRRAAPSTGDTARVVVVDSLVATSLEDS